MSRNLIFFEHAKIRKLFAYGDNKTANTETRTAFSQLWWRPIVAQRLPLRDLYVVVKVCDWSVSSRAVHPEGLRISSRRCSAAICIAAHPTLPRAIGSSLIVCIFISFLLCFISLLSLWDLFYPLSHLMSLPLAATPPVRIWIRTSAYYDDPQRSIGW